LLKNYFSLSFRAERGICFYLALLKTKQIPQPGKKRPGFGMTSSGSFSAACKTVP